MIARRHDRCPFILDLVLLETGAGKFGLLVKGALRLILKHVELLIDLVIANVLAKLLFVLANCFGLFYQHFLSFPHLAFWAQLLMMVLFDDEPESGLALGVAQIAQIGVSARVVLRG